MMIKSKKERRKKKAAKRVCQKYHVAAYDLTFRCACGHCCSKAHPMAFGVYDRKTGEIYAELPDGFWRELKRALRLPSCVYISVSDVEKAYNLPYAGEYYYRCSDEFEWGDDDEIIYLDGDIIGYGRNYVVREGDDV